MFLRDDNLVTHPTAPVLRRAGFPLLVLTLVVALLVAAYTIGGTQLCGVQQADLSSFAVGLATFARVLPSLARPSRALGAWYDTMTGLLLLWSYLLFGFLLLVMSIFILRAHVRAAMEQKKQRKAAAKPVHWNQGKEEPEESSHDAPQSAESPDEFSDAGSPAGEGESDDADYAEYGPATSESDDAGSDAERRQLARR